MKLLIFLLAVFALTATAADVSGTWKAAIETPNGNFETTFKLQADGDILSGSTVTQFGETAISNGKVDGDNISFTVSSSFNGNDFKLNYKGKFAGDEIKFTVEIEGRDRTFEMTAKRVTA